MKWWLHRGRRKQPLADLDYISKHLKEYHNHSLFSVEQGKEFCVLLSSKRKNKYEREKSHNKLMGYFPSCGAGFSVFTLHNIQLLELLCPNPEKLPETKLFRG